MKKQYVFILAFVLVLALGGCASNRKEDAAYSDRETVSEGMASSEKTEISGQSRILIAYFTWAENVKRGEDDVDAAASASVRMPGNVGQMAFWIQEETGGDLLSIQVKEPYSSDYDECLDRAADEKAENARPALKEHAENLAGYDTIFIGYPNWWYTAPMAVFSFLEENDLAGKKVVLFCSHGTGGLASSVKDIAAVLPDSDIEENVLGIYREDIADAEEQVKRWLAEIDREEK